MKHALADGEGEKSVQKNIRGFEKLTVRRRFFLLSCWQNRGEAMGKEKKYTPKTLEKAVRRYFASISRIVTVTERKPTGEKDDKGHEIYQDVPVINSLGEEMKELQYLTPPTVGGLSDFLGIHRDTWNSYCHKPEYSDTTTYAQGRMHAYLERESLTRQGKDLKGVLFNLENNYGYKERLEMSNDSVEEYLKRQLEEGQSF